MLLALLQLMLDLVTVVAMLVKRERNNGTALWPGLALRLGRPSELTRITLVRDKR